MSSAVNRFEDLHAWQFARNLTREIYLVTQEGRFAKDFGLRDQIQRAAVSVMPNIAEGHESARPSFIAFYQLPKVHARRCDRCYTLLWMLVI